MDKVLNLMQIVNEVDDLTNVAELKNQLQMRNIRLMKARAERDEYHTKLSAMIKKNDQDHS